METPKILEEALVALAECQGGTFIALRELYVIIRIYEILVCCYIVVNFYCCVCEE